MVIVKVHQLYSDSGVVTFICACVVMEQGHSQSHVPW